MSKFCCYFATKIHFSFNSYILFAYFIVPFAHNFLKEKDFCKELERYCVLCLSIQEKTVFLYNKNLLNIK